MAEVTNESEGVGRLNTKSNDIEFHVQNEKWERKKKNDFKQNENKRTFIKENSPQLSSIVETKSSKNTVCLNHSQL